MRKMEMIDFCFKKNLFGSSFPIQMSFITNGFNYTYNYVVV